MSDVHVAEGDLGGRGAYAGRAFEEGAVVVSYELRRLTREEYLSLPEDERRFVHSYWGERWLYPAPARYLNHADTPNTWQDFDRGADIAVRRIEPGERITTDAREETRRELTTFLLAYVAALDSNDVQKLDGLVDAGAFGWVPQRGRVDRAAILEPPWGGVRHGHAQFEVRDPEWMIGTGRWEAVCSYDYEVRLEGSTGRRDTGHVTEVLKLVDGNWQIVYRHASPA